MATFRNIREFLKATVTKLGNTLDSRRCKKRTLNVKYTSPQALHSHTSIITSSNDTATDPDPSPTSLTTAITLHAITTYLLNRINVTAAADADVTYVLHDTGGETITTSSLTPTLLSILSMSLFHTRDPTTSQGSYILPHATTDRLERSTSRHAFIGIFPRFPYPDRP